MKVIDCQQNSPEWHAARCGRCTGSRIADVTARTKTGVSAMRANYAAELVAERLSGTQSVDGFMSAPMKWGRDNEALACATYAFLHDVEPVPVGFVLHPSIEMAGASPDRLIGDKGLMQVKAPNTSTHIETLLGASIDGKYIKQMQWELACTEREWSDFCSFDPRLPPEMRLHVIRINRDDRMIAELEREVAIFLAEVEETVAKLQARYQIKAEAA